MRKLGARSARNAECPVAQPEPGSVRAARNDMKKPMKDSGSKLDPVEFDFSAVPDDEVVACAYYEYARESATIVQQFHGKRSPALDASQTFMRHPVTLALPPYAPGAEVFDVPWARKAEGWRRFFCDHLGRFMHGVSYLPFLSRSEAGALALGVVPQFDMKLLEKEQIRNLDEKTGLEVITITLAWRDFSDAELVDAFRRWVRGVEGRPAGVGQRSGKGRKAVRWRKSLERIGLVRLRHRYDLGEMMDALPAEWGDRTKYSEAGEVNRECLKAVADLHEFYPFLPEDEKPCSWAAKPGNGAEAEA